MNFSKNVTRLLICVLALSALALSGCSSKDAKPQSSVEGGRIYLDGLFYQVQLSRELNIKDTEDSFYLTGQPAPQPNVAYFGVFMRVDNEDQDQRILPIGIDKMKITDAKGNEYTPIPLKSQGWAYAPAPLGKGAHLPIPDTPADIGPIRGGMILFKIPFTGLDSRPLELEVQASGKTVGTITLDV